MTARRRFLFWSAILVAVCLLNTIPEHTELGFPVWPVVGALLALAISLTASETPSALLLAAIGWRLGSHIPECANAAVASTAARVGSWTGELWTSSGPWLFPPGHQLHADIASAGWPAAVAALFLFAGDVSRNPKRWTELARGFAVIAAWLPVRLIAWSWFFPEAQPAGPVAFLWLWGVYQCLTTLPLVALLAACVGEERAPAEKENEATSPWLAAAVVAAGMAAAFLLTPAPVTTRAFEPAQTVVIDETHSDWEPVVVQYDERTGEPTRQNNYVSMARFLSKMVHLEVWRSNVPGRPQRELDPTLEGRVAVKDFHLDREHLSALVKTDSPHPVLLLKCPTLPYLPAEVQAIHEFVELGGGLLMFGDHSDAFFLNTHLNPVAARYGIRFVAEEHYDAFGTWIETDDSCYPAGSPVAQLGRFLWATNCPLEVSPPARAFVRSRPSCFAEKGDYFETSFFGKRRVEPCNRVGSLPMMAGARDGKGKVLAFTDSTSFNNAYFSYPDRRLLWYLWLDWMRTDSFLEGPWSEAWELFAALAILGLCRKPRRVPLAAALFAAGFGLAWLLLSGVSKDPVDRSYLSAIDPAQVVFDVSHGSRHAVGEEEPIVRPRGNGYYGPPLEEIASLGVNARVSLASAHDPRVRGGAKLVVVVSPVRPHSAEELEGFRVFVTQGGRLLVIDGAEASPAVDTLTVPLGIELSHAPLALRNAAGWPAPSAVYPIGNPARAARWSLEGHDVFVASALGAGTFAVLGDDLVLAATVDGPPRPAALKLFRQTVRALLSTTPGPALASLAAEAAALDASSGSSAASSDSQAACKSRMESVLAKLATIAPRAVNPVLQKLALIRRIREARSSTGAVRLTSWPLESSLQTELSGARVLLAAAPATRARLQRLAEGRPAYEILGGSRAGNAASPQATASTVLVVHPSALVRHDRSIPDGVVELLGDAAGLGTPLDRLLVVLPETAEESLAADLLLALAALGPSEVGRWFEEAASIESLRRLMEGEDDDALLRTAASRLSETLLPEDVVAVMALSAARSGRSAQARLWLEQAKAGGPLLRPFAIEVARLLPAAGSR